MRQRDQNLLSIGTAFSVDTFMGRKMSRSCLSQLRHTACPYFLGETRPDLGTAFLRELTEGRTNEDVQRGSPSFKCPPPEDPHYYFEPHRSIITIELRQNARMSGDSASLKLVASIVSPQFRPIFPFPHFNHMQSIVAREAFGTDENLVISAPTGSGKTVIHELAICRIIQERGSRSVRCVYIAPNKSLCQQKAKEWSAKFSVVNQKVIELTGDSDPKESLLNVAKASIIVTTPEKWDSMTRTWRDHIYLMSNIDLLLVDEIHHLGEDRGATLEAVVVRMKYLASLTRDGFENKSPQTERNR